MQEIKIRPLLKADLKEMGDVIIAALLKRFAKYRVPEKEADEIISRYSPENLRSLVEGKYFVVAEKKLGGKLVGVAGLKKDEGSPLLNRLTTFYVLPAYQGKGIGKMLYKHLRNIAVKGGCKKLVVDSSPEANVFYTNLGFVKKRITWKKFGGSRRYYNVWMEQEI